MLTDENIHNVQKNIHETKNIHGVKRFTCLQKENHNVLKNDHPSKKFHEVKNIFQKKVHGAKQITSSENCSQCLKKYSQIKKYPKVKKSTHVV